METAVDELGMPRLNPSEKRSKLVVIMGPTGSGKSKLAIDLASHFPIEIINADSMQVYRGLDVLTNKVPFHEQDGVPHHLLGTISPNVEFTAKDFRDSAIPLINDILARNCIPVIVGGTNYYIQALVSPFLLDDAVEDADECCLGGPTGEHQENEVDIGRDSSSDSYDRLKDIDPVAANRIHPNNHRRITQYLNLYSRSGIPPSKFFQEKTAENWGQVDNFRYNCCFICVDSSLPVLDRYVDQRVDCMIEAGLLKEVLDIYSLNADYTRGLRQAIGVREFEEFLRICTFEGKVDEEINSTDWSHLLKSINEGTRISVGNIGVFSDIFNDEQHKMLKEAIEKMKLNTRRLVRRQKRRLNQLQTLFGWSIHHVDATESISRKSEDLWASQVVEPAAKIIRSFLNENSSTSPDLQSSKRMSEKLIQRDLWTQYTCKACGDRVLRGSHEWEQHIQGRGHRKRVSQLRKSQGFYFTEQQQSDTLNV